MASIHWRARKDGTQAPYVKYYDLDGTQRQRTFPDERTARRFIKELRQAHALGREWRPERDDSVPELRDIFAAFLKDCQRTHRPATLHKDRYALQAYLEYLRTRRERGRLLPDMLTRDSLSAFWSWLRSEARAEAREGKRGPKGPVSELTSNHYVQVVQRAWRWAYESDELGEHVPRPKTIHLKAAVPELEQVAPTWAEVDLAIAAVHFAGDGDDVPAEMRRRPPMHPTPDWYRKLLVVGRYTGLRCSQVMRLRWDDLDLDRALLRVRPELGKSAQERRGRTVPVTPHLIAEVKGWGVREGYLIDPPLHVPKDKPDSPQVPPIRPQGDTLHRIWERTGVDRAKWRMPTHCCRKAMKSELRRRKVQPDVLAFLLGHDRGLDEHYIESAALMEEARAAVALIPPIGSPDPETDRFRERRAQ